MKMFRLIAMMLMVGVCYVDGGTGGGDGGDGGGDGDNGGDTGGDTGGDGTLLAGKYKSQDELVTGYLELQTAFSGKDEAHTTAMNDMKSPAEYAPAENWGNDNAMNNRMMSVLQEVGKEHNMSQGMYESLFNGITDMQGRVQEQDLADTVKSIANYDNRANAIADTALRFLRPDQAKGMDALLQSKESFEAVEILMGQLRGAGLPAITPTQGDMSDGDLRKQIRNLNPADTSKRKELMDILNARNGAEGTLI